jgi:hypothetical protein
MPVHVAVVNRQDYIAQLIQNIVQKHHQFTFDSKLKWVYLDMVKSVNNQLCDTIVATPFYENFNGIPIVCSSEDKYVTSFILPFKLSYDLNVDTLIYCQTVMSWFTSEH